MAHGEWTINQPTACEHRTAGDSHGSYCTVHVPPMPSRHEELLPSSRLWQPAVYSCACGTSNPTSTVTGGVTCWWQRATGQTCKNREVSSEGRLGVDHRACALLFACTALSTRAFSTQKKAPQVGFACRSGAHWPEEQLEGAPVTRCWRERHLAGLTAARVDVCRPARQAS